MTESTMDVSAPEIAVNTGLTDEARKDVAGLLGVVLANTYQLMIKTQGVHWNVAGPAFYSIHKLTEEHYNQLFTTVDEVAERIRALGRKAPASYAEYGRLSEIKDYDVPQSAGKMVAMLVADHETVARSLREGLEVAEDQRDYVTSDMLIDILNWHEKAIWMLRALDAGYDGGPDPAPGGSNGAH